MVQASWRGFTWYFDTQAQANRWLAKLRKLYRQDEDRAYQEAYKGPSRRNMPTRRRKKKKASTTKRISAALTRYLRKMNPGKMKGVTHVRVKKLKGGGVTITPAQSNGRVIAGYGSTTMNPRRRNGRVIAGYGSTTMNPRRRNGKVITGYGSTVMNPRKKRKRNTGAGRTNIVFNKGRRPKR